jgi:hypothetical protein
LSYALISLRAEDPASLATISDIRPPDAPGDPRFGIEIVSMTIEDCFSDR